MCIRDSLDPDCDDDGLIDGEEPEGCVLDPTCGEIAEEPLNVPGEGNPDPTPTATPDPIPTTTPDPTPEEERPEVVILVAETSSGNRFPTLTFIWGIVVGIAALLFLFLLVRKTRCPFVTTLVISDETSLNEALTFKASSMPSRGNKGNINSITLSPIAELKDQASRMQWVKNVFAITFTNEAASSLSYAIDTKELKQEKTKTFMECAIPSSPSNKHSHTLRGIANIKILNEAFNGRLSNITWGMPSTLTKPKGYRLEGLTTDGEWRLITEFSVNQDEQAKPLLDADRYTHVRLRSIFRLSTSQPSVAVPVGSIRIAGFE